MTQDVLPRLSGSPRAGTWGTRRSRALAWPNPGLWSARNSRALGKMRHEQGSDLLVRAGAVGYPGGEGPAWAVTRFARALLREVGLHKPEPAHTWSRSQQRG